MLVQCYGSFFSTMDGVASDSAAPSKEVCSSSQKHCTACKVPVKDHVGPHGKERCVLGVLEALRTRVSALEEIVEQNERRHSEELRDQAVLHEKRVDGLMALIEDLQQQRSAATIPTSGNLDAGEDVVRTSAPNSESDVTAAPTAVATDAATSVVVVDAGSGGEVDYSEHKPPTFVEALINSVSKTGGLEKEEEDQDDFVVVQPKGRRKGDKTGHSNWSKASKPHANRAGMGQLCGAKRVQTTAFHLRGISMDCSADDILAFCRKRNVTTTGCFMLRTRIWGTQSAKLFVAKEKADLIARPDFWPELICCRPWERDPPRGAANAGHSKSA